MFPKQILRKDSSTLEYSEMIECEKCAHSNNVKKQKEDYSCLYMMTGPMFFIIFAL